MLENSRHAWHALELKNGRQEWIKNQVEVMFLPQASMNEDEKCLMDVDGKKSSYVLVSRISI